MKYKPITVIIPTFNRAWSLPRAIDSVMSQTSCSWQLVIVDDGSTDNTKEVIARYLTDERITYHYKENGGVGSARNFGVQFASGEYVTFLDSDDELLPQAVEIMLQDVVKMQKLEYVLTLYLSKKNNDQSYIDSRYTSYAELTYEEAVSGLWPRIETIQLVNKNVFRDTGFPEQSGGMESIFWHRLLKNYGRCLVSGNILRIYHTDHDSRLTAPTSLLSRSRTLPGLYESFLEQFGSDYERINKNKLAYFYIEKGVFEIIAGKTKTGRSSLATARLFNSRKSPIIFFIMLLSYLPDSLFLRVVSLGHKFKQIIQ